jgi:ketosteroid isomerase-like protein
MTSPKPRPATPVERDARQFWAHFDAKDHRALVAMMTKDALETDDLANRWLCGRAAIEEHFAGMGERYHDSHTVLEDVQVSETADTAVLTCVVHYQMRWDGQPGVWRWPTTMIFVRQAGEWRIALLHTK